MFKINNMKTFVLGFQLIKKKVIVIRAQSIIIAVVIKYTYIVYKL
jgi:hypothetical protein